MTSPWATGNYLVECPEEYGGVETAVVSVADSRTLIVTQEGGWCKLQIRRDWLRPWRMRPKIVERGTYELKLPE